MIRSAGLYLGVTLILCIAPLQARQAEARLTASLSSAEANLGDPVTLRVELFLPPGWQPQNEAPLPPNFAEAKVLSQKFHVPETLDETRPNLTFEAVLAWYKLEAFTLPSQPLTFIDAANQTHQLVIPELEIQILNLLDEGDANFAPDKGQMALTVGLWLWILLACIVLILLLALAIAIWYYKNREPAPVPAKPLPPPHLEALDALAALTSNTYLKEGKVKAFYVEVALIIRHYYGRLYDIHAEEMTSFELEDYFIQRSDLPPNFFDLNRDFQELCDRVKFAKYDPLETETKQVVNMAYEIVELLKPQPATQGGADDVATR